MNRENTQAVEETEHDDAEEHFKEYTEDLWCGKCKNDHAKESTES